MVRLCGEIFTYDTIGSPSIELMHNKYTSDIAVYELIRLVVTTYQCAQAVGFQ